MSTETIPAFAADLTLDLTMEFGVPSNIEGDASYLSIEFEVGEKGWGLSLLIFADELTATFAQEDIRQDVYVARETTIPAFRWPRVLTAIVNKAKRLGC